MKVAAKAARDGVCDEIAACVIGFEARRRNAAVDEPVAG